MKKLAVKLLSILLISIGVSSIILNYDPYNNDNNNIEIINEQNNVDQQDEEFHNGTLSIGGYFSTKTTITVGAGGGSSFKFPRIGTGYDKLLNQDIRFVLFEGEKQPDDPFNTIPAAVTRVKGGTNHTNLYYNKQFVGLNSGTSYSFGAFSSNTDLGYPDEVYTSSGTVKTEEMPAALKPPTLTRIEMTNKTSTSLTIQTDYNDVDTDANIKQKSIWIEDSVEIEDGVDAQTKELKMGEIYLFDNLIDGKEYVIKVIVEPEGIENTFETIEMSASFTPNNDIIPPAINNIFLTKATTSSLRVGTDYHNFGEATDIMKNIWIEDTPNQTQILEEGDKEYLFENLSDDKEYVIKAEIEYTNSYGDRETIRTEEIFKTIKFIPDPIATNFMAKSMPTILGEETGSFVNVTFQVEKLIHENRASIYVVLSGIEEHNKTYISDPTPPARIDQDGKVTFDPWNFTHLDQGRYKFDVFYTKDGSYNTQSNDEENTILLLSKERTIGYDSATVPIIKEEDKIIPPSLESDNSAVFEINDIKIKSDKPNTIVKYININFVVYKEMKTRIEIEEVIELETLADYELIDGEWYFVNKEKLVIPNANEGYILRLRISEVESLSELNKVINNFEIKAGDYIIEDDIGEKRNPNYWMIFGIPILLLLIIIIAYVLLDPHHFHKAKHFHKEGLREYNEKKMKQSVSYIDDIETRTMEHDIQHEFPDFPNLHDEGSKHHKKDHHLHVPHFHVKNKEDKK